MFFHLKCTELNFGWGSTPDPLGAHGELTALPRPASYRFEERGREKRWKEKKRGE